MKASENIIWKLFGSLFPFALIHTSSLLVIDTNSYEIGRVVSSYEDAEYIPFETRWERSVETGTPKINFRDNCTCGVRSLEKFKIAGGHVAEQHAWPWAVALVYTADKKPWSFCGASLINSQYLLTAAHCAEEMLQQGLKHYQPFLGINAISDSSAIKATISQVIIHPNFNSTTLQNDAALIKLTQPVVFSERVHPVCLKQDNSPYVGLSGVVVGWGSIRRGEKGVDRLREVKIQVISNGNCAQNYSAVNIKITGQMMCASLPSKDACQGDSGGPFVIWDPNSKVFCQVGIVSFGLKCGSPTYPGVYGRVNSFIKWIQKNTLDATYCQKSF